MRPDKYKTKKARAKKIKFKKSQKIKSQTKKDKKSRERSKNRKRKGKKGSRVRLNRRNNLNNDNNYREATPRPVHICDNIEIPKSLKSKRTRIFAIIGHSSFCTFNDLLKIKENREPEGFRVDLKKYKDFHKLRYISAQDIGKKSSALRMENFINQLKTSEKIHSGFIQLDDIKSTTNFNKLVDCDLFNNYKEDYALVKKRFLNTPSLNFNVYPKKDTNGTQNPINAEVEFLSHHPNTPFTGIYELTEKKEDSENSNNNYNSNYNSNNNNDNFSWDIHSDEILFNPVIKDTFQAQRERDINLLEIQSKIINTKENRSKNPQDPTYISENTLHNTKLAILKGSLMIPNHATNSKLKKLPESFNDDFTDFTRLNKQLFNLIEKQGKLEVNLDDIIDLILTDNYLMNHQDFIILDFGCKHIKDLKYTNNVWSRPNNTVARESTVRVAHPLREEVGSVWEKEPGTYPYIINKLFAEAGN